MILIDPLPEHRDDPWCMNDQPFWTSNPLFFFPRNLRSARLPEVHFEHRIATIFHKLWMDSCGFLGQLHNTWSMDFQHHLTPAPMGQAPLFLNVFVSHAWQEGFDEFVQYVVARLGPLGFGIRVSRNFLW